MMWIGIAMVVVGVVMYSVGSWRGKRMREDGKYTPLEDVIEMDFQFRNVNPNRAPKGGPLVSQTKPLKLVKPREWMQGEPWAQSQCLCAECERVRRNSSIVHPAGRSE